MISVNENRIAYTNIRIYFLIYSKITISNIKITWVIINYNNNPLIY